MFCIKGDFMRIAVFAGQISLDSQSKVILGIYDKCKQSNVDLDLYALHSSNELKFNIGEFEHLNRLDFNIYDGFILYTETLYSLTLRGMLLEKLQIYNKPIVSIDTELANSVNIMTNNSSAMEEIVEHLITEHNVKVLNFISGPLGSTDAALRKQAFLKVLTKYGLSVDIKRIFIGDFFADSGTNAIEFFEENNVLDADAYVCANDQMALGAFYGLQEKGIRVPQDCLLTGYDNIVSAEYNIVPITSVARYEFQIGQLAYDKLVGILQGAKVETLVYNSTPIFRKSCCKNLENDEIKDEIIEYYTKKNLFSMRMFNIVNASANTFLTAKTVNELCQQIPKYLQELNIQTFCICLDKDKIGDLIDVPLCYHNNVIENLTIHTKQIIPPLGNDTEGVLHIITPLHYMDTYFGYAVLKNSILPFEQDFYRMFINNIDNALYSISVQTKTQEMITLLEESSLYDPLTKLKNRNGFFKDADALFERAKKTNDYLYLLFADLDGLKEVNDTLGHKVGDKFICDFADVLRYVCKDELMMRFGGDEFVVLGRNKDKFEAKETIAKIQTRLNEVNAQQNNSYYPYQLNATIGYFTVDSNSDLSLLSIIDNADKQMYTKKKRKKAKQVIKEKFEK